MPTPLERARSEPESQKAAILHGARRVFARRGYHGSSTRAIAAEVGVDVSTIYYHWGSKAELFDGVLEDLQARFVELLRAWLQESKDLPFDVAFDRAVELAGPFMGDEDSVRVLMFSVFDEEFEGADWAVRSQRALIDTLRTFAERRLGVSDLPVQFDALILSTIGSILALVGGRKHQARVLGLDPDSPEYRGLVVATIKTSIGALVMAFAPLAENFPTGSQRRAGDGSTSEEQA